MKVGVTITVVCLLFLFIAIDPFGLGGCRYSTGNAVENKSVSQAKNVFNLATTYASDHNGVLPNAFDMEFLNDCVANGIISKDEIDDYRADGAEDGTTKFHLIPNLTQTMRGSTILAISRNAVNNDKFTVVTISGKAECLEADEALEKLIATLESRSWQPRSLDGEK